MLQEVDNMVSVAIREPSSSPSQMAVVDKVQAIEQNKHRNLSSKFISMSISHLVANSPEIPVSNIILEMQQTYTLPCSHVLAVCRENGSRTDTYVPQIYSRQTYKRTYQANFHPVLSEDFWRDVPFNLAFYPPNMKKERGRKQGKPFQGEMDYRNPDSPPRCDDAVSSQSELDNDNDPEEGESQTPQNPVNPINPVTENIVAHWESSQWFSSAMYDYTHSRSFLDMGSGSPIDDLVESGTVRLLNWNDSMTGIQLGMRFVDKVQAISAVPRCYHHSDDNYCSWYIRIKKKAAHGRWEITRFVKEHTCLVQIEQNKHKNLSSKFISMSISYLVANDPMIPVSNIIQEVQVLFKTGWDHTRACC
ncbi:hypothetical protein M9H77_09056 [Catharanthus roseus]|uniref:Uncharacterized protein n=1 Tax=Catharanthus roseus TaxID=4058 RepID=A0ACC0BZK2_CATRO|nr:hypothetical protein M9H77_09056 [Catharanthus roseus]